jgi:hypothetical protein
VQTPAAPIGQVTQVPVLNSHRAHPLQSLSDVHPGEVPEDDPLPDEVEQVLTLKPAILPVMCGSFGPWAAPETQALVAKLQMQPTPT